MYGPVEDEFDFSMEYDIVIRWAITNSTCQKTKETHTYWTVAKVSLSL